MGQISSESSTHRPRFRRRSSLPAALSSTSPGSTVANTGSRARKRALLAENPRRTRVARTTEMDHALARRSGERRVDADERFLPRIE